MKPTHHGEERLRLRTFLAREYAVREHRGEKTEALNEAAEQLEQPGRDTDAFTREQLKQAVEALSGNRNTVVYDDFGLPSVMVRVPLLRGKDLLANGGDAPHPAFSGIDGEILVGKYQCSLLEGHACSLPLGVPISAVSLDEAEQYCKRKGAGWGLTSFALRMAIALWCRRQGFLPHGNNCGGQDYYFPQEKGIPTGNGPVLCGSGPASWAHDGTPNGLYDLNGNLNEWDAGFRLMNGEIQMAPTAALLAPDADMGLESPLWKAMDETGAFVAPGTSGTLKYDAPEGHIRLAHSVRSPGVGNCAFCQIEAETGLEPPMAARLLGLYPEENREGYGLGWRWISTYGETAPLCGGGYRADDHAGVFFVGATYPRTKNYDLTGFRAIYLDKEETKCPVREER